MPITPVMNNWHRYVRNPDSNILDTILGEQVVFHSPVVHTPQTGKKLTKSYLVAASKCLFNDTFNYKNEIYGDFSASLEFVVIIQGIHINGVDLIGWNANQEITSFKVMIRPLKAVNLVRELMTHQLT